MLADTLKEIAGKRLVDTDGDVTVLELLPPATDAQVRALEASIPSPLPDEIRAALAVSTGLANGPLESFALLDLEGFGLEEAFPHAYSIAHDGYGNYWILDLLPDTTDWGPVFFACHDPAVIAYQAPSIDAFLRDVVAQAPDDPRSPINRVHEDVVNHLWRDESSLIAQPAAASSSDVTLREFANTLTPDALIADMRQPTVGSGFAWGKFGPRTVIQRFGTHLLWALTPPPSKPGIFARLFGK
jgi:hypothetical protein